MIITNAINHFIAHDNPFDSLEYAQGQTRNDGLTRVIFRKGTEAFIVSEGKVVKDSEPVWVVKRNKIGRVRVLRYRF